jgi:hypothetical protein
MGSIYAAMTSAWLLSVTHAAPVEMPPASVDTAAETEGAISQSDAAAPVPPTVMLKRDTPIHFMVVSEVTTKTHLAGHRFRLRVDKPVVIDGITIIAVGATAWGEVIAAKKSGNVGKSGSLEAKLLYVESGNTQIPVSGTNNAKGASGGGETALGILALGPLGLFAKGNNAKIKAGELMTGFVEQDTQIPRPLSTAP